MEITNENKAKVFAQYLGQKIELDNGGSKVRNRKLIAVGGIDDVEYVKLRLGDPGKNQFVHSVFFRDETFKLILKPLSAITDQDAIEVATYNGYDFEDFDNDRLVIIGKKIAKSLGGVNTETLDPQDLIFTYESLRYKGYDLPNFYLKGKTLKEAGLAIYE